MCGATGFLLFTATGLKVSTGLLTMVTGGSVSIGSSEGSFTGNWLLRDILITTEAAEIRIDKLSSDWQPRRLLQQNLHIADLLVDGLKVLIKGGNQDNTTDQGVFSLPHVVLPVPFLIGRLQVDDITVLDASGKMLFDARFLSAGLAGDGEHIDISDLQLDAPYMGINGEAHLVMSADWPLTLNIDWWGRIAGCGKFSGSFKTDGTLADPSVHIDIIEPDAVQIDLDMKGLFDAISYRASVSGSEIALAGFCVQTPGVIDNLQVDVTGDLEKYEGSGQAALSLSTELMISSQISFHGDRQQLVLDTGSFGHGANRLDATGSLNFDSDPGWNVKLSTHSFDLSEFLPVPGTLIDGNLDVYGEVDGDQVSYVADLHDLEITILEHNLEIGGGLSLKGDQNGLEVTTSSFVCGEGSIGVQGNLSWQDYLRWEADILLDSFNPAVIDVFPEGNINGNLTSTGTVQEAQLDLQAEITSLSGELSGYELAGEGLIVYRDEKLTVKGLNITNGNNSLQVSGDIGPDYNVSFQINGSELERVFPLLNGTLNVDGTMSGVRDEPVLSVSAVGKGLLYREYGVEGMQIEAVADLSDKVLQGTFDLTGISSGNLQADQLTVSIDGDVADHTISGVLKVPRTDVTIHASGSVSDTNVWHGEIETLELADKQFGRWKNRDPVLIDGGAESVTVENFCLSSAENLFCVDASWDNGNIWSLAARDVQFDLASLNRWGFLDKPLTGSVEGHVSVNGQAGDLTAVSGYAAIDTLQWKPGPNSYYQDFRWFDTSCTIDLVDKDLIVELSTRFVDDSRLDAQIGLSGITDFSEVSLVPVSGQIDLDLKDVTPLSVVTAEFLVPQGYVTGTVEVDGTLGAPRFLGNIDLVNGGLNIPFLGVDVTDVQGTLEMEGSELSLDLDGRAGEGSLNSAGSFDFGGDAWSGQLKFTGSNCSLLDRRAISAAANPDLALKLGSDGGTLTGTVEVLRALIEVEKFDRSATESSDVVFIDKEIESTPWPFRYDITVSLGDDVNVEGFGLNGSLGGNLEVANNADGTIIGRGFFDVREGSFAVYGSPLTISRGRISFDGGPVDNPGLDIKATKFIDERRSGYEKIEVGANVIGSADDFEVELYSIPSMEEGNILTYILFDNPFSAAGDNGTTGLINSATRALGFGKGSDLLGGVNSMLPVDDIRIEGGLDQQETSLVVGKKLSKDLSVSYDYNLFNNDGSFRVRYEFGKGFSVESRSSFESNAVELMYSFER